MHVSMHVKEGYVQDSEEGAKQTVHVLITTYTEPLETVRCAAGVECLYFTPDGLTSGWFTV